MTADEFYECIKYIILKKARRRRKQAEDRRLKVVEQERSVKEDIEKSEDKRNRKFLPLFPLSV